MQGMEHDTDEEVIENHIDAKRLKRVTEMMLDMKRGMMEDFNVEYHSTTADKNKGDVIRYSRNTREQADKVRVYLEFFYALVEKNSTPPTNGPHHEGVDDVYNPLQVIRNRKIRKKHGDKTRDFHLARPPVIAIKDFSQRNSKFPWLVDIMEKSNDYTWRANHWDELKKPDGTLWFGQAKLHQGHASKDSVYSIDSLPDESSLDGGSTRKGRFDKLSRTSGSRNDVRETAGSRSLLSRLSRASSKRPEPLEYPSNNSSKIVIPKILYQTPSDYETGKSAIIDVPIDPIKRCDESSEAQSTSAGTDESTYDKSNSRSNSYSNPVSSSNDDDVQTRDIHQEAAKTMYEQYYSLKCMRCSWNLLKHREHVSDAMISKSIAERSHKLTEEFKNFQKELALTGTLMHDYDEELSQDEAVVSEWKTKFLTDYSNRINVLISFSDRFLSDINTTLTLRVKILQENIEKFSVLRHVQRRTWTKLMYRLLELFIVSSLWMVWLIFSIIRLGQMGLAIVFRIIKWAFF